MKAKNPKAKAHRLNRITGNPKKWICHDQRTIDQALDCLEVLYSHWRGNKKLAPGDAQKMLETASQVEDMILRMSENAETLDFSKKRGQSGFWDGFSRN